MTPFSLLCSLCGLSTREAAAFHGVRHDTALSWSSGRRNPPQEVLKDLADLHRLIDRTAQQSIETMKVSISDQREEQKPAAVMLGYCADDAEAQSLGFTTAGSHAAMLARVAAAVIQNGLEVRLVPRGSASARAAAADAHQRQAHPSTGSA